MATVKKINGVIFFIVFVCLILRLVDDAINTNLFTFVSATSSWNLAFWLFLSFFILSCISLFKKELIFKYVPYVFM